MNCLTIFENYYASLHVVSNYNCSLFASPLGILFHTPHDPTRLHPPEPSLAPPSWEELSSAPDGLPGRDVHQIPRLHGRLGHNTVAVSSSNSCSYVSVRWLVPHGAWSFRDFGLSSQHQGTNLIGQQPPQLQPRPRRQRAPRTKEPGRTGPGPRECLIML